MQINSLNNLDKLGDLIGRESASMDKQFNLIDETSTKMINNIDRAGNDIDSNQSESLIEARGNDVDALSDKMDAAIESVGKTRLRK